jgi:pteridine reductase
MFEAIRSSFGRLDVLVNNAAVYDPTPIKDLTADQWDAQFAINARAAAMCIRHALPLMTADRCAIVNVADAAAQKARSQYPAYCASKAALLALTSSTAKALAPGVVLWPDEASQEQRQAVLAQVPMKRPGSPQDVAAAVAFLVQQDYITGQNLRVDGGWHMG